MTNINFNLKQILNESKLRNPKSMQKSEYFNYLKTRSKLALFYRNYFLYPKLCLYLKGRVLDVGCGIGDFVKFRKNTIGIDINTEMVEYCKMANLNVKEMEPNVIPFPDKSFEGVVLDNVLEHIKNPQDLILEIKRVLKEKNTLIVGVPGISGYKADDDHKVFYTKENLIKLFKENGFREIKTFGAPINFHLLSSYVRQYCIYSIFKSNK